MRRTVAGLLFAMACSCAAVALSGFWLQRVAFSPGQSGNLASVVLEDSDIKAELIDVISRSTAAELGGQVDEADVRDAVTSVANNPEGAELLGRVIEDSHARLIGESDEPVTISGDELVQVVRTEAAAPVTVTIPVPQIRALELIREVLRWLVPAAAIAAVVLVALGVLAHPDKLEMLRGLGVGLLVFAVVLVVLGYVVPAIVVPALSDSPWIGVAPQLADDALPLLIGLALVLAGGGLGCLVAAGVARRNRRWSQPIRVNRYGENTRWG